MINYNKMYDESQYTTLGAMQELILFAICVAGKQARQIAPRVSALIESWQERAGDKLHIRPAFSVLRECMLKAGDYHGADRCDWIANELKCGGIGCYHQKATAISAVLSAWWSDCPKSASVEDFEKIPGIGRKTARFIYTALHPYQTDYAVLDTHVLYWLKNYTNTKDVPLQTPQSEKQYTRLEQAFIHNLPGKMSIADFDLLIWKAMRAEKQLTY